MAQTPEQHSPLPQKEEVKDRGIALIATPEDGEQVFFQRNKEGGLSIKIKAEVTIAHSPSVAEASQAVLEDTAGVTYGLVPERVRAPVWEHHSGL